jgi:hypothetical protein
MNQWAVCVTAVVGVSLSRQRQIAALLGRRQHRCGTKHGRKDQSSPAVTIDVPSKARQLSGQLWQGCLNGVPHHVEVDVEIAMRHAVPYATYAVLADLAVAPCEPGVTIHDFRGGLPDAEDAHDDRSLGSLVREEILLGQAFDEAARVRGGLLHVFEVVGDAVRGNRGWASASTWVRNFIGRSPGVRSGADLAACLSCRGRRRSGRFKGARYGWLGCHASHDGQKIGCGQEQPVTVDGFGESNLQASHYGSETQLEAGFLWGEYRNLYHLGMKTTLNLNDQLLADAKALAAQQRTSLTRVIEEGLQLRLRAKTGSTKHDRVRLPVYKGHGGLVEGVDPLSNKALLEALGDDA